MGAADVHVGGEFVEGGVALEGVGGGVLGVGGAGGDVEGAGFGGAAGLSNDARMREIGGRTSRFGFTSPSSAFLRGFFLSMSEMLSTSWRGAGATSAITFADGGY